MTQHLADLALEIAHAGFARVVADYLAERLVGDRDLLLADAVRLELPLDQVATGDLELLLRGVAGEADDLHAVAEGPRDRVEEIGGGDEDDAGEIEGHESYRLQLWPAEEAPPELIKYWPGFDVMRPDG